MTQTHGDHYNITCPHCKKTNLYITAGVEVEFGKIKLFKKPCFHCNNEIHYHASYEIKVIASDEPFV